MKREIAIADIYLHPFFRNTFFSLAHLFPFDFIEILFRDMDRWLLNRFQGSCIQVEGLNRYRFTENLLAVNLGYQASGKFLFPSPFEFFVEFGRKINSAQVKSDINLSRNKRPVKILRYLNVLPRLRARHAFLPYLFIYLFFSYFISFSFLVVINKWKKV